MAENINDFFGDKNIANATKLGAVALCLKGTYNIETGSDGKSKTMTSLVCRKNGITPVLVEINNPNLSALACKGLLKSMGLDSAFGPDFADLFEGKIADNTICEKLADAVRNGLNLNPTGMSGVFQSIKDNLLQYFEVCDIQKNKIETFIANIEKSFLENKKKQMMDNNVKENA